MGVVKIIVTKPLFRHYLEEDKMRMTRNCGYWHLQLRKNFQHIYRELLSWKIFFSFDFDVTKVYDSGCALIWVCQVNSTFHMMWQTVYNCHSIMIQHSKGISPFILAEPPFIFLLKKSKLLGKCIPKYLHLIFICIYLWIFILNHFIYTTEHWFQMYSIFSLLMYLMYLICNVPSILHLHVLWLFWLL